METTHILEAVVYTLIAAFNHEHQETTKFAFCKLCIKSVIFDFNSVFRPCKMFCNPLLVESIEVKQAIKIDANHMIVVYKRLKDSDVQRRVIQGPSVFVPEAEEW